MPRKFSSPISGDFEFFLGDRSSAQLDTLLRQLSGCFFRLPCVFFRLINDWTITRGALNRNNQHWHTRRYGTGSGSDRAPAERALSKAPGRYRSRYRTNVACFDLERIGSRRVFLYERLFGG